MKFVCDRCQTKYSIADDRVRGKVLKVKCKTCANLITVREARRPSAGMAPLGSVSGAGVVSVPASDSGSDSERTVLAPSSGIGSMTEMAAAARRPSSILAPVGSARLSEDVHPSQAAQAAHQADDGVAWYMALDGKRTGPFSRKQLVDKVVALPRDADLHVWNETLGGWKPPAEVPAVAADLIARRKVPPPPPGAPRRPTPMPPPVPGAVPPSGAPRAPTPLGVARAPGPAAVHASPPLPGRPSATHMPVGAALASHLPSPSGSTGTGHRLPAATASGSRTSTTSSGALALATAPAAAHRTADAASLLETPAPLAGGLHAHGTNGTHASGAHHVSGTHAAAATSSSSGTRSSSDVLQMLNLSGGSQAAAAPAPRIMSAAEAAAGWGGIEAPTPKARSTRFVIALLGIVAVICGIATFSLTRKPKAPPFVAKPAISDPLAAVVDKLAGEGTLPSKVEAPPSTAPEPIPAAPSVSSSARGKSTKGRGGHAPSGHAAAGPSSMVASSSTASAGPAEDANAARFRDNSRQLNITTPPPTVRPPPSQADITRVINNNRSGIKNCYQRALLRDSSLTHGKITVQLSIGISGRVKHVGVNGPAQFRALEPCIKEVTSRWAFPQASEEYGTEFAYVFQGNE